MYLIIFPSEITVLFFCLLFGMDCWMSRIHSHKLISLYHITSVLLYEPYSFITFFLTLLTHKRTSELSCSVSALKTDIFDLFRWSCNEVIPIWLTFNNEGFRFCYIPPTWCDLSVNTVGLSQWPFFKEKAAQIPLEMVGTLFLKLLEQPEFANDWY